VTFSDEPLTNESFAAHCFSVFPFLEDLDWSNVLLAGGCLLHLLDSDKALGDLDFFLYDLPLKEAKKKALYILQVFEMPVALLLKS
jgi:hypothetical protein